MQISWSNRHKCGQRLKIKRFQIQNFHQKVNDKLNAFPVSFVLLKYLILKAIFHSVFERERERGEEGKETAIRYFILRPKKFKKIFFFPPLPSIKIICRMWKLEKKLRAFWGWFLPRNTEKCSKQNFRKVFNLFD